MFAGVIFDCDGVLVDSERIAVEIDRQALAELGIQLSLMQVAELFMGKSNAFFLATVSEMIGRELPESFMTDIARRYSSAFETQLEAVEGIREALEQIDLPYCVASSGTHEKMQHTLGLTNLLPKFQGKLFSSTQVANGKPHPDLFLYAASQMGWQPEECLVVEDSHAGIEAGLSAGMRVVAYEGPFVKHDPTHNENLRVIKTMSELPKYVSEPSLWSES